MSLSVIIASCNREERAFATVQSLLDTGFKKVIIVDDGSHMPYRCRTSQERLTLLRLQLNRGPSSARNHGAGSTESEWMIFLDDDDSLEADFLDWVQTSADSTLEDFDLVHFGYSLLNQDKHSPSEVTISTSENPTVLSGSWMIRREFFQRLGGYEERLRYSENSDLIERACQAGARTLHAGFPSLLYTVGRPKRREEMAGRRAQACLFYLKYRPQCERVKMLKIGLVNSWWDRNPWLAMKIASSFAIKSHKSKK